MLATRINCRIFPSTRHQPSLPVHQKYQARANHVRTTGFCDLQIINPHPTHRTHWNPSSTVDPYEILSTRRLTPLGTAVCSGASGSGEAATRRTREMDDVGDVGGLLRRAEASCGSPWISKMYSTYIHIIYLYSKYLQHGYVWGEMELFRTGAKCWEWGNDPIHTSRFQVFIFLGRGVSIRDH